jgi:hypothetical protein
MKNKRLNYFRPLAGICSSAFSIIGLYCRAFEGA